MVGGPIAELSEPAIPPKMEVDAGLAMRSIRRLSQLANAPIHVQPRQNVGGISGPRRSLHICLDHLVQLILVQLITRLGRPLAQLSFGRWLPVSRRTIWAARIARPSRNS